MKTGVRRTSSTGARHTADLECGRLVRDENADLVLCHVCGRAFRSLGSHVRAHDMTAAEYREEFGLLRTRALSARALSLARSAAQRAAFDASARMRSHFAVGQAMARDGELSRQARRSFVARGTSAEFVREQAERLASGRRTQVADAAARLEARVRTLGYADVGAAVQALYVEADMSMEATARVLGVGNEQMRQLLDTCRVRVRAVGENSPAGRRARVASNDLAAAQRVGTEDIAVWLGERRSEGVTLAELAARTGRSIPWVVSRTRRAAPC
ncbi:MucR family transcriptional regulator [Kitasatospora sp. NPDC086009]|uniref:MucR family transcriptional regulator n=1 Tax=unclassified Kitasatospora TaxID=2633591 RepID=UPI0037CB85AE